MNRFKFLLAAVIVAVITLGIYSCAKDNETNIDVQHIEFRKIDNGTYLLSKNWSDDSYLKFNNKEEVTQTYEQLKELVNQGETTNEMMDSGIFNPALDTWEITRNSGTFVSMRRAYEQYTYLGLEAGLRPEQIRGIPIINDALAALISPDGLVRVGNEIQYFSDVVYASAPFNLKNRLREIVEGGDPISPNDIQNGIKVTTRTKTSCNANFSMQINHNNNEVFVTYTGSPTSGGDKSIVWSVENGASNHKNETSFSHKYSSIGEKTICVTYTETGVVKDTTYTYHQTTKDSTYTIPGSSPAKDTTVKVIKTTKVAIVNDVKKVICTDTQCKTFTLGGCTVDFDFTIGLDNVVNFVDKSSTKYGTITGWQWNFGDGISSNVKNPTHAYPCDRSFDVTLIIFSNQCPNGSLSVTRTIDVSGAACCDKNPQSSWKTQPHPTDPTKKKIKYRYDMGTNWDWLFDQDFKAKIEYYEHRRGGIWPFKRTDWFKTKGLLDVDFAGDVFAKDEEGCRCISPRTLIAQPDTKNDEDHTFIDHLSASAFGTDKTHWMKDVSPVNITYKVNGITYLVQHCQSEPGFHCE